MGRAKGAPAERAAEELAEWLRSLRQLAGLSYSRMAHASTEMGLPISSCTLFRASTGRCLPAWSTVHAYAKACGGSISRARRLWKRGAAGIREEFAKWLGGAWSGVGVGEGAVERGE